MRQYIALDSFHFLTRIDSPIQLSIAMTKKKTFSADVIANS